MRSSYRAGAAAFAVFLVMLPPAAAGAQALSPAPPPTPTPSTPGSAQGSHAPVSDVILSNETTHTTWTTANYTDPVYAQPSTTAARITRLRLFTTDGFPQAYLVLRERRTRSATWLELRLPMRPNGLTGWVQRDALATFSTVNTQLIVDRASRTLTLYRAGRFILRTPVGVGKPSTPTPPGHFWIVEKFPVHGDPFYGPYAFGTSDYSVLTDWPGGGIVGLHGTSLPQLVPGDPSHGCMRLHNSDVMRLSRLVPVGTPLLVL